MTTMNLCFDFKISGPDETTYWNTLLGNLTADWTTDYQFGICYDGPLEVINVLINTITGLAETAKGTLDVNVTMEVLQCKITIG